MKEIEKLERYKPTASGGMKPEPDGEWVLWEDSVACLKEAKEAEYFRGLEDGREGG